MSNGSARYVDDHAGRFVDELCAACRIPSVSAAPTDALDEMASFVHDRLSGLLDRVTIEPTTGPAPAVIGELAGAASVPRLLLYSHYDVQPPEPLEDWSQPPFEARVVGDAIVARGVADDKADVLARIHALEAWRALHGALPFTLVWLCEGAEEVGSKGLPELLDRQRGRLQADACLWESYLRRSDGTPEIGYGCRGMLYVQLDVQALDADVHSSFRSVYRSAPAELARALASLTDETGLVLVDGFHDAVVTPEPAALAAAAHGAPPPEARAGAGTSYVLHDRSELVRRLFFEPTANVAGLWAGYSGPGSKTVLPASAHARLDFRLVPDQDPDEIAALLRRHLDDHGFGEIELTVVSATRPARTPLDVPLGEAVVTAARDTMGEPARIPFVAGTGPVAGFQDVLAMPVVMPPGVIRPDSGIHAPNENCRIADYLDLVRFNLRLFELLGAK